MARFFSFLRRHLHLMAAVAVVVAALAVFVLVYFQPQKLFLNETVNDPLPTAPVTTSGPPVPGPGRTATGPAVTVLATGHLISRGHPGSGTARVLMLPDGSRILRLENLHVENGPDLRVRLTGAGPHAPNGDFGRDSSSGVGGHRSGNSRQWPGRRSCGPRNLSAETVGPAA